MRTNSETALREALVEYGRKLLRAGLVQGTWGNLSVRLNPGTMLVTPSGLDYEQIGPEDIVAVSLDTMEYEGELRPTSESVLHAGLYRERPDVGAIIHTHSKYASIFAAARMPLQIEDPGSAAKVGELIRIAEHGMPGSERLAKNTIRAIGAGKGCIMSAHGMICVGETLADTFDSCEIIEEAAKSYINKRWGD